MSYRGPVRVQDRHNFDVLIDARSPSEFALDHLPGAINCPVLDDEERRIVGTLYKQQGAFEARRVGGAMVAANLARHLWSEQFADQPAHWKPLVYCWRGGMRSGSMVTWLRLVGWEAQQLAGGYKAWRRHVMDELEQRAPKLPLRVLCGATGSGKTRILQALAAQGEQVLDLEDCARHRGSVLGAWPGVPQPSQTAFETALVQQIEAFDLQRPVYVEAESAKIGLRTVPLPLLLQLRSSPCIEVGVNVVARLEFLLRDYAHLGDDRTALAQKLGGLRELHGNEVIGRWQVWALAGELRPLFGELMARHYDPLYQRSQRKHLFQWEARQTLEVAELSSAGIAIAALQIAAMPVTPA